MTRHHPNIRWYQFTQPSRMQAFEEQDIWRALTVSCDMDACMCACLHVLMCSDCAVYVSMYLAYAVHVSMYLAYAVNVS